MRKLDRILVATDFSAQADRAVERAAALAAQHGAHLVALHVVDEELPNEGLLHLIAESPEKVAEEAVQHSHERLQQLLESLSQSYTLPSYEARVTVGHAHTDIVGCAQEVDADAVVLGAHGRHGVQDLFLSSTAEHIVRQGDRPMLVVKGEPQPTYRRILAAVDFSETSRLALEAAVRLAPEAELQVLHVYSTWLEQRLSSGGVPAGQIERYHQKHLEHLWSQMDGFLRGCDLGQVTPKAVLRPGYAARVVTAASAEGGADLLAVGTHGHSLIYYWLVGRVAMRVLHTTSCDVLAACPPRSAFEPVESSLAD
jgi:nucleotide-binding universal stress UspA family protein